MALFLFFGGKEKSLSIFFWEFRNRKITDDNWGGGKMTRERVCVWWGRARESKLSYLGMTSFLNVP